MKHFLLVLVVCLTAPLACLAQVDPFDGKGVQPYGDYDFADFGAVNVENGNLNLDIKLLSFKQAGRLPDIEIHFVSDSETWQVFPTQLGLQFLPGVSSDYQPTTSRLITNFRPYSMDPITYDAGASSYNGNLDNYVNYWGIRDWKGALHLLSDVEQGGTVSDTIDGSGLRVPSATFGSAVYDRQGTAYSIVAGGAIAKDLFGNQIVTNLLGQSPTVIDSVGRVFPTILIPNSPGCLTNTLPGPPATDTVTITVCSSNHSVATDFQTNYPTASDYQGSLLLIDSITLPNGKLWQFFYNSFGDMESVAMPTGGSATFQWETHLFGPGFGVAPGSVVGRRVISKTVNDANGNTNQWKYSYEHGYVGGPTIVTDPAQNDTVHKFDSQVSVGDLEVDHFSGPYTQPSTSGGACSGFPSAPNLIMTEFTRRIAVDTTVNYGRPLDQLPTDTWTYWPSGKLAGKKLFYDFSRTYTDSQYENLGEPDQTTTYTTGSAIETDEYDYGHCAPGALVRQTLNKFEWQSDSSYTSANLIDAVASTLTKNGSGQTVAQSSTQYDFAPYVTTSTRLALPTTVTSGIGADQTSTHAYYTYAAGGSNTGANPNGTMSQSIDGNGNSTSYTYQCSGATHLAVTNGLGQTTKYGYSCDLGRLTSIQDPNDLAANRTGTQYQYTSMGDLSHISYPDTGSTTIDYHGYNAPLNVTITTAADSPIVTDNFYDGLGRVVKTQKTSDPAAGYVDTTYDGLGRVQSVSNPYQSTGDLTYGISSFAYDPLGRKTLQCNSDNATSPTNICTPGASYQQWAYAENILTFTDEGGSQWQRTSDGLGRLTQVKEPGATSKAPTLETDYTYSALGDLVGVNQKGNGSESPIARSFTYDSLSRLVCASNPESERIYVQCPSSAMGTLTPGTVGYTYDANGNAKTRTDARGITTSYNNYDALNRLGSKSYSDSTPSVSFSYDSGSLHGTGNLNFIGRMSRAMTMASGSVLYNYSVTGYDPMGRSNGYTECPASSDCTTASSFQQVGYLYDLDGNPKQVFSGASYGASADSLTRNYTYDGGANLLSVTAVQNGASTALFSSPTYSPFGSLTGTSLATNSTTHQPAIGIARSYDRRLRLISENDTAVEAAPPAVAAVTVNITGTEQSSGNGNAAQATGTISLSYSGVPNIQRPRLALKGLKPAYVGNSITLPNGYHVSFVAAENSAIAVADSIATVLNQPSSPVSAVVSSGGTASAASVTLTTKTNGAGQNGAVGLSLVSTLVRALPASLAGGAGTNFDTGTVTANINGVPITVAYEQSSTPQTIVQSLVSAISAAGMSVTASAGSNGALTITASEPGTASNGFVVTLSSLTGQPGLFSAPSFSGSSGTLSGGSSGSAANSTIYSYTIPSPATATSGYAPNGNLLSYTDSVTGAWNFTSNNLACYDPLNRITCGNATSGGWAGLGLTWSYDSFGNRTTQGTSGSPATPAPLTQFAHYDASNHVTSTTTAPGGFLYDDSGNVINDGANKYAYDAEGRLCVSYNGVTGLYTGYAYDGLGNRVAKGTISSQGQTPTPTCTQFTPGTNFVVGLGGEQLDELDGQGTPQHSNVYGNGQLLATYLYQQSSWNYAFADWLGTKRFVTDSSGSPVEQCMSLPFGDALQCYGPQQGSGAGLTSAIDPSEHHFTGKERDTESGLDYFGARYYGSSMGRFTSPDGVAGDPEDPQSWNLYSYVRNKPTISTDPDGHDCIYADGNGGGYVQGGDCTNAGGQDDNGVYVDGTIDANSFKYNAANNSSSFSYKPYDAPAGTIGTGVLQGPNRTNGFEPGDLAAGVFGPANNAIWNNAANGVKTVTAGYAAVYAGVVCYITCPAATAAVGRWGLQRLAMGASSPALLNIINRLYQAQDELPGGTAGILRNEVSTGEYITYLGGHAEKAENTIRALQHLINSGELSGSDQTIAGLIISDLKNALSK